MSTTFYADLKACRRRWLQRAYLHRFHCWEARPLKLQPASALVFAPHPDDETLGCGGMIASKRQQGWPVQVVFLTDGNHSHDDHGQMTPASLGQIRQREAIAALETLGVTSEAIHWLHYPDSQLASLAAGVQSHLIEHLIDVIQTFKPDEVYVPFRRDFHPDHEATYRLVQTALTLAQVQTTVLQYPVWMLQLPWCVKFQPGELAHLYRLPIHGVLAQKQAAIAAYQSQIQPLPPQTKPILMPDFLRYFMTPYELFFRHSLSFSGIG